MNSISRVFFSALMLGGLVSAAEPASEPPPTPDFSRAFVTIPYGELRSLWEIAQAAKAQAAKKEEAAPLSGIIQRADLELQLGDQTSALSGKFEVEALNDKWLAITLLGGEVRLDKVEAAGRQVVWLDGYTLLTNQPGPAAVTLQGTTRGAKFITAAQPLRLKIGRATVKRLQVSGIPAGLEARVDGQAALSVAQGSAVFSLSGDEAEITLQLAEPKIERPPAPPQPSQWQTASQTLVRYTEGRLQMRSRIFAHSDAGSGLEMQLALPANAAAVTAVGDDVSETAVVRQDDGRRLLRVRWKTADLLDRELTVTFTVPQSPLAEQWAVQAPSAPEDKAAKHLFAILPADGLELTGEGLRTAVASHRLPAWMREEMGGAAFVTAEGPPQLNLQAHWLPVIATAEAIVAEAKCQLRLVTDGSEQTTVSYSIRHRTPLAWTLEIPADVRLLSCTVNGQDTRPIQRASGPLELNLRAPTDAKGLTQVALVYAAKTKALDAVSGQVALEMPRTPLFIEKLDWSVVIPGAYEITAAEGNVTIAGPADAGPEVNAINLRKELCSGERPSVELFYQRRVLEK